MASTADAHSLRASFDAHLRAWLPAYAIHVVIGAPLARLRLEAEVEAARAALADEQRRARHLDLQLQVRALMRHRR